MITGPLPSQWRLRQEEGARQGVPANGILLLWNFPRSPNGIPSSLTDRTSSHGHAYLQDRLEKVVFVNRVCYLIVPHHDALRKEERAGPDQQ